MSSLKLFLLGPPRLERDGVPLEFDTRKNVALIAYLAVTGHSHTREALTTLLWPELEPSRARAGLRRNLSMLRKALDGEWLVVDRETVGTDPDAGLWLDVEQFREMLQAWQDHGHSEADVCPQCLDALDEAVELYRGDFLEGFTLRDSPSFDEFQFFQTEGLRQELASALKRLVRGYTTQAAYERAIQYARHWLALDLLHEPAHRHLMELYAQAGQWAAALRQYEECARVLEEELDLSPSAETTSLYERIRTGIAERGEPSARSRHNLPVQTTPFVGRRHELAEIEARLSDPDCRLLTLVGPGGSGKTRLALEAAMARLEEYEHGVYFVSLAPLRSVDGIVPTVAQAIGLTFYSSAGSGAQIEPWQQLIDYLRQKRMLLVLDNFEHLLEGAELVTRILAGAPGVKVLVTSRAGLRLEGEHLFPVGGMGIPKSPPGAVADASQYSAVELFLRVARRVRPSFELTDENLSDVVQVCRLVDGKPLGIRLAAAWVEILTPAEIGIEIGRSLDFLETDLRDVPARQRSMRAVFDHSWNLLSERERAVFAGLSAFYGGFTREAAQQVTGASLRELAALMDKSLLHRAPTGRYEVHELLRQYAEEKLDQEPAASKAARDLHCAYYTVALQQWGTDLKGPRQKTALIQMDLEIENVRAAWDWAAEQGQVEQLDRQIEGLGWFYFRRSRFLEGEAACRTAASKLAAIPPGGKSVLDQAMRAEGAVVGLRVWAKVLAWQSSFTWWIGQVEVAGQLLQQSLALLEGPALADQDTRAERAFILFLMGEVVYSSVSFESARRLYEQSLALYRAPGNRWWTAYVLHYLGILAHDSGSYGEAERLYKESLTIARSLGDQMRIADTLLWLGVTSRAQGQLEEAARLYRESLAIHQEMDDQVGIARGFWRLGEVLVQLGKIAEGCSSMEESLAIYDDLGFRFGLAEAHSFLGEAKVHLGQYEQARAFVQRGLTVHQENDYLWAIGFSHFVLGLIAVAEEAYAEAYQLLQASVDTFQEIGHRECMSWALAVLGYAARGLGRPSRARQHLCEALRTVADTGGIMPALMYALPAVALLLANQSEVERAVEIYALASRHPFVANSRWFEDVAGRQIAAVAATLPPEVVAAARERGRARDLDATMKELLAEFWERASQMAEIHDDERADA